MKTLNFNDKLLSIKDVSELLQLSEVTIKRYIYNGKIPSIKVGNARRVRVEDIKDITSNTPIANSKPNICPLKIIPGYMGIKTQVIEHINIEINKIANKGEVVLDIFSGSGVVGYALKKDFIIYSNDIEFYSNIINKLLIDNSLTKEEISSFDIDSFWKHYEINLIHLSSSEKFNFNEYKKNTKLFPYILFTEYFSDSYFGKLQSMQIDSLRYAIDQVDNKYRNLLLSCLIFACYQTVSSVGSHFAQPKIDKEKNNKDITKKRSLDVKDFFFKKFNDISENLFINKNKNKVFNSDFKDLFHSKNKKILSNVSVTYIDPPYTIDHYSRFYHILNTLVLYDYPEREGKGIYRSDRYQSNFCIKSKALQEFDLLVSNVSGIGSKLVMSYSDSYRSLLKTDEILKILKKYYQANSVKNPIEIEYSYSGFGQSAENRANELLFVATIPK